MANRGRSYGKEWPCGVLERFLLHLLCFASRLTTTTPAGSCEWSSMVGRLAAQSVVQAAENIGSIPLRGGGMHATAAKLLPFDGDAHAVFAYVETAILVNEAQESGEW